jgi:uncharacterized repeat protein (TIGR02543 family)
MVNHGNTVSFTITPNIGYTGSVGGTCPGSLNDNTYITDPIISNCTVEASFTLNTYTVSGVSGTGGSITPGSKEVYHGDTSVFTVDANIGYKISEVTGCGGSLSGSTYTTGPITSACTVISSFSLNEYTISLSANPLNTGTLTGADIYSHGDEVTLTATANTGYTFINWTEGAQALSFDPEYTFIVTGNRNLTANFSPVKDKYEITLVADPGYGGMVAGGGFYDNAANVTVIAIPHQGWGFSGWFESGLLISKDLEYSFIADSDRTLKAQFIRSGLPGVLMLLLGDDEGSSTQLP